MTAERVPVEAGHILQFARAVGDPNPIYRDADYAAATPVGGVIAPPTFLMAADQFDPHYDRRWRPGQPWRGSGREPSGGPRTRPESTGDGFHAEQHFDYLRHPRAGEVLTAAVRQGRTWEKEGRRGGRLVFEETVTEYRDADGDLVVRARWVEVHTERPVKQ